MALRIAPSILDADLLSLGEAVDFLDRSGAECVHLDIMDGHFVPNLTFGAGFARAIRKRCRLPLEAHLMVQRPEDFVPDFLEAGVQRVIVHQEGTPHIHRLLQSIRNADASPGVVINPGTPAEAVREVLDLVDMVLLMSVNPGWGGQKFISGTLDKIRKVKAWAKEIGRTLEIEVDGGVNRSNILDCARAGATMFVVGSAIFKDPDPAGTLAELLALEP